jgi:sodium/bile acid cotransporter 7
VDWFLVGLAAALGLALLFPEPGARGGWLRPEITNKAGVALIFFLHGLTLSFDALKAGVFRWKLHLVVQTTTFVVFPLLGWALVGAAEPVYGRELALGVFFLCALPSTVSSSVAMTAAAHGNVAGAVFNATLSSLLGIVLTPLWLGVVLGPAGAALPFGAVVLDLMQWLVLPLAVGQVARPLLGNFARHHKARITLVDRATILLLVYTSSADSVKGGAWEGHGAGPLLLVLLTSSALLATVMLLVWAASAAAGLPIEDRIAAFFCGSKKTLAAGVPMAHVIFGAHPALGLILLPILVYHPLQLVVCAWFASRWGRRELDWSPD